MPSTSFVPYWGFNAQQGRQEEALVAILDGIADRRFPVNQKLSENALAVNLGMSRTPVREALSVLAMRGFIRRVPQVGFWILPVTLRELQDTLDPRLRLEQVVAEVLASGGAAPSSEWLQFGPGLDHARVALERMRLCVQPDATEDQQATFQRQDTMFHYALACAAGILEGAQQIQVWRDKQRIFAAGLDRRYPTPDEMERIVKEHISILDAIDRGDPEGAKEAVSVHLSHALDRLRSALEVSLGRDSFGLLGGADSEALPRSRSLRGGFAPDG
jgi:GntR family transcriptional regulator, rspAB operon transcriptional repressor